MESQLHREAYLCGSCPDAGPGVFPQGFLAGWRMPDFVPLAMHRSTGFPAAARTRSKAPKGFHGNGRKLVKDHHQVVGAYHGPCLKNDPANGAIHGSCNGRFHFHRFDHK